MRKTGLLALVGGLVLGLAAVCVAADTKDAPAAPPKAAAAAANNDASSITVYVTETGKSYHADGCKFLAKSKKATTLAQVAKDGLSPCSVCKPPQYVFATGTDKDKNKLYHLAACKTAKGTQAVMSLEAATLAGFAPCADCKAPLMVFVTDSGKSYHRAECTTLANSKSKTGMLLEDAKKSYKPCGTCKPPE